MKMKCGEIYINVKYQAVYNLGIHVRCFIDTQKNIYIGIEPDVEAEEVTSHYEKSCILALSASHLSHKDEFHWKPLIKAAIQNERWRDDHRNRLRPAMVFPKKIEIELIQEIL